MPGWNMMPSSGRGLASKVCVITPLKYNTGEIHADHSWPDGPLLPDDLTEQQLERAKGEQQEYSRVEDLAGEVSEAHGPRPPLPLSEFGPDQRVGRLAQCEGHARCHGQRQHGAGDGLVTDEITQHRADGDSQKAPSSAESLLGQVAEREGEACEEHTSWCVESKADRHDAEGDDGPVGADDAGHIRE